MEQKTSVTTENGRQEIFIERDFDIPVPSLFTAFIEPEIIEQWRAQK